MSAPRYDLEVIRERLPMLEVAEREGVEFKRQGGNWIGPCFACASTKAFTVHGNRPQHAHCYSCGWDGDIFQFWGQRREVKFPDAVAQLAGLCGAGPLAPGVAFVRKPVIHKPQTLAESGKPWLPEMRRLRPVEREQLAALRGLSRAAIDTADRFDRVGFSYYPVDSASKQPNSLSVPSWVVTDPERWVAQWRRLDGKHYYKDDGPKSLSTRNTNWPIGAAQLADFDSVILVEGGADMLAAYHFLEMMGLADAVAVCCILGSGNNIIAEARAHFSGKRVRIIADNDAPRVKKLKAAEYTVCPGLEAAARWEYQLSDVAESVEVADLSALFSPEEVKDLNDLARADCSDIDLESLFCF
jgi:hypothetical protein